MMTTTTTATQEQQAKQLSFLRRLANLEIDASCSLDDTPVIDHEPRIIPSAFAGEMERLWAEHGNAPVAGMPQEWLRILDVFISAMVDNYHRRGPTTRAYAGQLGLGKSMSAQVALAALAAQYHLGCINQAKKAVGGILVVERVETAERAAQSINRSYRRISGRNDDCAITKHSRNDVSFQELETYPILVVTHEAYRVSLNKLVEEQRSTWNSYTRYAYGKRLLTIVDEAFNPVQDYITTSDDVRKLVSMVTEVNPHLYPKLQKDASIILSVYDALVAEEERIETGESIRDTTEALNAIRDGDNTLEFLYQTLLTEEALNSIARSRREPKLKVREFITKTLSAVDRLLNQWSYYASYDARKSFNSARWLIPDDVGNLVILDGTAHVNETYMLLFGEDTQITRPNVTLRDYSPVTLHIGHTRTGLGKDALLGVKNGKVKDPEQPQKRAESLLQWCKDNLSPEKKILVCTHKEAAPVFKAIHDGTFAGWDVTWWGNTTGSNAWHDFDVAITTSIFRKPTTWAGSAIAAKFGVVDGIEDMKDQTTRGRLHRLIMSDAAAEIIQFLGRVKVRKPIDTQGRCAACDLYVLLGRDGNRTVDGQYRRMSSYIQESFPGAEVKDWELAKKVVPMGRPMDNSKAQKVKDLLQWFQDHQADTITREAVLDFLGIDMAGWRREWRSLLKQDDCDLCSGLSAAGWERKTEGAGRWQKMWWERKSTP